MKTNLFTKTRIKLTFAYLAIILFLTGSVSFLFYQRVSGVLENEFSKIEQRPEFRISSSAHLRMRLLQENFISAKHKIALQLFYINSVVAIIFLLVSYYLSGKTLEPIEEALKRQKQFVADAAHELRTPIAALKTNLEVELLDKDCSKESRENLINNLEDLKSLEILTQNLLKLAHSDEEGFIFTKIDLIKSVKKVVRQVGPLAKKKQIQIKLVNGEATDIYVMGAAEQIEELARILLDNAVKYSPKKSDIRIEIKKNRNRVGVAVIDQGSGIDERDLPFIFERFYRADSSRTQAGNGGYGLGLAIAKQIVSSHHGQITVKSRSGRGTTFMVSLPRV